MPTTQWLRQITPRPARFLVDFQACKDKFLKSCKLLRGPFIPASNRPRPARLCPKYKRPLARGCALGLLMTWRSALTDCGYATVAKAAPASVRIRCAIERKPFER